MRFGLKKSFEKEKMVLTGIFLFFPLLPRYVFLNALFHGPVKIMVSYVFGKVAGNINVHFDVHLALILYNIIPSCNNPD